jgi:hypothetical protein
LTLVDIYIANWQTQLTVLEKNTFLDFFKQVDADNKGIVLQDEAMEFLKKSDIPQNILLQVKLRTKIIETYDADAALSFGMRQTMIEKDF